MTTDPYSTPETSPAPATPPPMMKKPARMIVFGILHIVGAVFGLITLVINFAQGDPRDAFKKAFDQPGMKMEVSDEALSALDPVFQYTTPILIGTLLVAVPLLISGIGLLMSTTWSLKLSNIYVALSLIMKIATLVIGLLILGPAYDQFFDAIGGENNTMIKIMKTSTKAGIYAGLAVAIYPILSFILLNNKVVKDHLRLR
ncbi:hypothetical protein N9Z15_03660 [Akkermansiaceae bacterium]|nr:hypothetical protein [Akkermansiaceae bacterium]MDB4412582.1 hypothetical protein [bacterium]